MTATTPDIIEGAFRVVATATCPGRSPNRQRAAARIVFWNFAFVFAVVALPILFWSLVAPGRPPPNPCRRRTRSS